MTSSLKATGHAAVRGTPAASVVGAAAWALTDLGASTVRLDAFGDECAVAGRRGGRAFAVDRRRVRVAVSPTGSEAGIESRQARVSELVGADGKVTTQLNAAAALAPAILEENIAALAVDRRAADRRRAKWRSTPEIVADLVRRALTEFPIEQSGAHSRTSGRPLAAHARRRRERSRSPARATRAGSPIVRIARGGCLIEGRDRIVDGRIDTALERAYHRMALIDAS